MKKIHSFLTLLSITFQLFGQAPGNVNYQNQVQLSDNNINVGYPSSPDIFIKIKGLANVKADAFVAIFSVSQFGKTTQEVNNLIDGRINQVVQHFDKKEGFEIYIDMVSFVPMYEYDVDKKVFSKNNYNEIPIGFELKKNIHIKYSDASDLNEIVATCSNAEIYNLVRVDYFSDSLEQVKLDLVDKSKSLINNKLQTYGEIVNDDLSNYEREIMDGFIVRYPVEMYKTYQAYSSSSLNVKKFGNVKQQQKATTLYYQPILDKEFDFVMNPTILDPVIQVFYEIKLKVKRPRKDLPKPEKEYLMITPNGDFRRVDID